MIKKTLLLAGLGLALSAGQAMAEDDTVHYTGSLNPTLGNQNISFLTTKEVEGLFHDTFTFSFSSLAGASAGVANGLQFQIVTSAPNVDFSQVRLNGVLGTVDNSSAGPLISLFFAGPVNGSLLNAPAYTLEVWGTATVGAQYGGSLNVSMVPEPETLGLMLAGLGFLAVRNGRRREEG